MKTIKYFVWKADRRRFDNKVSFEDLVDYIIKHNLQNYIPVEKAEKMFWDAATCRKIIFESNKTEPLSEDEIYAITRI